jgi:thiol:disulfide interchange protein
MNLLATVLLAASNPFTVTPKLDDATLRVSFAIPAGHHLYADNLTFEVAGQPAMFALPAPTPSKDRLFYERSFDAAYRLSSVTPVTLTVRYQGCDEANCFLPQTETFLLTSERVVVQDDNQPAAGGGEWRSLAAKFSVAARSSGYLNEHDFISFLDRAESDAGTRGVGRVGIWATVGFILLGGLGLNLTPCILPLVPVNLAIIGAGAQASSRRRGFLLGGTYAAGMAIAYGALGAVVVLTGSKFGALNSSPWFNLAIAGIFGVLALAMFDVFTIDFSRFQTGTVAGRSKFVVAYTMGSVAALLAGACVAPVVISVLVQATSLYNRGVALGLALPFLLGLGMGLPWPFAGAGLSFLPKPGKWMTRVKYGFGVVIVLFALHYGHTAFVAFRATEPDRAASSDELVAALRRAQAEGQPVLLDFWASWCKNCAAMEHTTFRSVAVQKRLGDYVVVRLQAERPNESPVKELLDHFGAIGLPTYIVLRPHSRENSSS